MKSTSITGILLLMMVWNVYMATEGVRAMSCGDVSLNLGTCMYYLAGIEPRPPFSCCDGVRHLKSGCEHRRPPPGLPLHASRRRPLHGPPERSLQNPPRRVLRLALLLRRPRKM
uniref:Bifunctional inhibitor/plant lipid transfer protein/seed storage helical domain-containing protein n=1 Tax=Ananas comosus var. bracteatus TaxID=296719 RepID=A0A6V7NM96_ANACO|nr:unnamed protein product [Ananas comosus var. bracteatus]